MGDSGTSEESTIAAVTQASSCCSVVTVMRTGSVYIGRLKDRGTHRRTEKRGGERERAEQMHRRGKAGFMQGVKARKRECEKCRDRSRQKPADRRTPQQ